MDTIRKRYPYGSAQAVSILHEAEKKGKLNEAIAELFSSYEHDMITIWKCREFFDRLPDSFYEANLEAVAVRILIEAMRGNLDICKRYIDQLGVTPDNIDTLDLTACSNKDIVRIYAELVMPQFSDDEFLKRLIFVRNNLPAESVGLALTACRPSVINGFRDFTFMCPSMEEKQEKIEYSIEKIYGSSGKGIYEVGLAEWNYEVGNTFDALVLVAGTIPALEKVGDTRCLFAAIMLQIRILILNGQSKPTAQLFDIIQKRIEKTGYEELESSLRAYKCLLACYQGENDAVKEWLANEAPDENEELFTMDMFAYLIKLRCYIQTGQYMMAVILGNRLLEILKPSFRYHDICEIHALIALACYKAGDNKHALSEIDIALTIAMEHKYVRVIADEGHTMQGLLKLYCSKDNTKASIERKDSKELKQIRTIALEVAGRFPNYLGSESSDLVRLTKTEQEVLQLMYSGLTNEEIAFRLSKKEGTIKFHTANIYRKFNVQNRLQAINYAKKTGVV